MVRWHGPRQIRPFLDVLQHRLELKRVARVPQRLRMAVQSKGALPVGHFSKIEEVGGDLLKNIRSLLYLLVAWALWPASAVFAISVAGGGSQEVQLDQFWHRQ